MSVYKNYSEGKYNTTVKYPTRRDFKDDAAGYAAAMLAYRTEEVAKEDLFKVDTFEELGITGNPKAEMLYQKAYEISHAYGYNEIYGTMQDLVELIT